MAQWLRALTALPKVLSSNPSNHMVAERERETERQAEKERDRKTERQRERERSLHNWADTSIHPLIPHYLNK